jgi:UDP-N-acetylmuramate-alanine ligase
VSAGLAIGTGSEPKAVFASLELLEGAKGRLERVAERNGAPIFVDYAHKPDALAKALQALRPYANASWSFRRRRRPRRRKAPDHGRDCGRECRSSHRHRR